LIAGVRLLTAHVGDTSKLILDPDLDTYYTMDGLLNREPELIDRLSRLGDQVEALFSRGTPTFADRVALTDRWRSSGLEPMRLKRI
jgi:hypothetical protein